MKNFLIAGNWKMNTNAFEAEKLAEFIFNKYTKTSEATKVLICPPFTNLQSVGAVIRHSEIYLGAQNCYHKPNGAFTGEISIPMLSYLGCTHIIIGHSERRAYFHEDDNLINNKAKAILEAGLTAIVCIGETLTERENGRTFDVLKTQIKSGLDQELEEPEKLVIAYEPVWAIGTGVTATTDQVNEAHLFIRNELIELFGVDKGSKILIQYGGSVTAENAKSILSLENVNGALIGGASLKGDAFISIINDAQSL